MTLCAFCFAVCRPDGSRSCDCRAPSQLERVVLEAARTSATPHDFRRALRCAAFQLRERAN